MRQSACSPALCCLRHSLLLLIIIMLSEGDAAVFNSNQSTNKIQPIRYVRFIV